MNEREIIQKAITGSMPDIETVRNNCIEQCDRTSADGIARNRRIKRLVPLAACVVIALAVTCSVPYIKTLFEMNGVTEGKAGTSASHPTESTIQPGGSSIASLININELMKMPTANKMNIALMVNDFVKMDKQKLCDFYGINVFPSVIPKDMTESSNSAYGIYKRDNGTGDVYFSQNVLQYANSADDRTISIEVSKGGLTHTDIATFENNKDVKSTINDNEISIGHYSESGNEYYYAEFLYHNIGFRIIANNLSKGEFIDMLSSVLR